MFYSSCAFSFYDLIWIVAEAKNKDEERRKEAIRGFHHLAKQISDPDAIIKVLQAIFSVLVKG